MSHVFASEWPTDDLSTAQRPTTPEDSGPMLARSDGYGDAQARYQRALAEIFGDGTEEEPDAPTQGAATPTLQDTKNNDTNMRARDRKAMKQQIIHDGVRRSLQKEP